MKYTLFALLTAAVLVSGCASTPTRVNSGKIKAKTFSFVNIGQKSKTPNVESRKRVNSAIQETIKQNLESRGLTFTEERGDVTVAYLVIIGDNVSTTSIRDYFGYGRDYQDLQEKAHKAVAINNKNPNYFEAGTLLIDLIDSNTQELLFRNYASRELFKDLPDATRMANLKRSVEQILKPLQLQ